MAADQRYLSASRGNAAARIAGVAARATRAAVLIILQLIAGAALARDDRAGVFDYYVLALSWSPTYCGSEAGAHDGEQCTPGRRFAFVVHGLWPQFEKGWPENCSTGERWVPEAQIDMMLDIMPSRNLVIHEWKKHGSCSGLSLSDYFDKARALFAKIRIPARYLAPDTDLSVTPKQVTDDFVKSNRELRAAMLSVQCGNRSDRARLSELRVCFDRDGAFRACGENERRQCRAETLILPRVR
jgi:ribonuclease T2